MKNDKDTICQIGLEKYFSRVTSQHKFWFSAKIYISSMYILYVWYYNTNQNKNYVLVSTV